MSGRFVRWRSDFMCRQRCSSRVVAWEGIATPDGPVSLRGTLNGVGLHAEHIRRSCGATPPHKAELNKPMAQVLP
jgi:hypothetical protein